MTETAFPDVVVAMDSLGVEGAHALGHFDEAAYRRQLENGIPAIAP